MMKNNTFQGDLTEISAETKALRISQVTPKPVQVYCTKHTYMYTGREFPRIAFSPTQRLTELNKSEVTHPTAY